MKTKSLIIFGLIIFVIALLGYLVFSGPQIGAVDSDHSHANFLVFINGEKMNFALPQYMVKVREVHIEDMNGVTIHKHTTGVTLGYFFKTLGFKFNEECFVTDEKEKFCTEEDKKLNFYVNGNKNSEYGDYDIVDGEKYLISYGSGSNESIQEQLDELNEIEIAE